MPDDKDYAVIPALRVALASLISALSDNPLTASIVQSAKVQALSGLAVAYNDSRKDGKNLDRNADDLHAAVEAIFAVAKPKAGQE